MENINVYKEKIQDLMESFAKNQILPFIGFEFEFYIVLEDKNAHKSYLYKDEFECQQELRIEFLKNINKIIEKSNFNGKIECEKDPMQFEMISNHGIDPCSDFENMLKSLEEIENYAKIFFKNSNIKLNKLAKPFESRPGNGLHLNLSLHQLPSIHNLFGDDTCYKSFIKNEYMAKIIGVMLVHLKKNIQKFFPNESILKRIKFPDRNTPINFSWGYNNRTTALRIPESLPHAKVIEQRTPSSENNFYEMVYYLLECAFIGMFKFPEFLDENQLTEQNFLQEPTFGLAFDKQYKLEKFFAGDFFHN